MVVTYLGNRLVTWRGRSRGDRRREIGLFVAFNMVGLALSVATLVISHDLLGLTSRLADNISANVIGLALGTLFRYWSYRRFVFAAPAPVSPRSRPRDNPGPASERAHTRPRDEHGARSPVLAERPTGTSSASQWSSSNRVATSARRHVAGAAGSGGGSPSGRPGRGDPASGRRGPRCASGILVRACGRSAIAEAASWPAPDRTGREPDRNLTRSLVDVPRTTGSDLGSAHAAFRAPCLARTQPRHGGADPGHHPGHGPCRRPRHVRGVVAGRRRPRARRSEPARPGRSRRGPADPDADPDRRRPGVDPGRERGRGRSPGSGGAALARRTTGAGAAPPSS
jgi:hypothetical protein